MKKPINKATLEELESETCTEDNSICSKVFASAEDLCDFCRPQEDTSTVDIAIAARKAWTGRGGLQAALRQYRAKHPGSLASLFEVLKERPGGA